MANEATVTVSLTYSKGSVQSITRAKTNIGRDVSGDLYFIGTQTVGSGGFEALELGKVSNCGLLLLMNNDPVNYVEVQIGVGGTPTVRLQPGDVSFFRLDANNPYVKANSAPVTIEIFLLSA